MKPLAKSRDGLEGLPLQLIITAIILAITVPMMFGALRNYDRSMTRQNLVEEIDDFAAGVQNLFMMGPGNSQTFEFTASGSAFCRPEQIMFGDNPTGEFQSVIRFRISGMAEEYRVIQSPNVPMMNIENETLEILSGTHMIIAECRTSQLDLNGDGHMPDNYMLLSVSET